MDVGQIAGANQKKVAEGSSPLASTTLEPSIIPSVTKAGGQLQFSLNSLSLKNIQKVEFYVEGQFIGTAFVHPYSVVVSENTLTVGPHSVLAKIYTDVLTTQTNPATFTADPTVPVAPSVDESDLRPLALPIVSKPPTQSFIVAPTDVAATVTDDGTSATLTWAEVDGAVKYQIWRDGAQVATSTGVGYTDTGLNTGQTYDYSVVAIAPDGALSAASDMVAVTMPTPRDFSAVNGPDPLTKQALADPTSPDNSGSIN